MEQLNSENGEFQQQIQILEQNAGDKSTNLSSLEEERDKLKDSLQETTELCLQMESKLSSDKLEKEKVVGEYESKIQDLEEMLIETEAASEGLAVTEKEKAKSEMADMETKHHEVVAGLQSHVADSTSQISKLIDQLSTVSTEKVALASKMETVASELSAAKDAAEPLASKVKQLETTIESLSSERDAANAKILISSGNECGEQRLSSLQSERDELKAKISNEDEERHKKVINLIGEPLIRNKLLEQYDELFVADSLQKERNRIQRLADEQGIKISFDD